MTSPLIRVAKAAANADLPAPVGPVTMIGRGWMAEILFSGGGAFRATLVEGFCAANYEFAPHEFLVVKFADSAFGFIDGLHLHKGKALGAHIVAVENNLDILD